MRLGLTQKEAAALVNAATTAAGQEMLDVLAGEITPPSSVADGRALRLRYLADANGDLPPRGQVEILFRVTPSGADSVIRRMQALYPASAEAYLKKLVQRGIATRVGTAEKDDLGWELHFPDPAALDHARRLLERKGVAEHARVNRPAQTLRIPRHAEDADGRRHDPLKILGVPAPAKS